MESMIPLIIALIVGALLSGKKKKNPSQQEAAKPFTAQQGHQEQEGPVKKLKEMYKELQKEMQQENQEQQLPADRRSMSAPSTRAQVELQSEAVEVPVISKRETRGGSRTSSRTSSRSRQSTRGQSTMVVQREQSKLQVESIIPKSKDDLIKGVIFSEIYGPPKSKR